MKILALAALVFAAAALPASAQSLYGSSQQLGPFTYYNYTYTPPPPPIDYRSTYRTQPTWPTHITGNSQQLGPFRYDTWNLGNGRSVNCTTQHLGGFAYTNCY